MMTMIRTVAACTLTAAFACASGGESSSASARGPIFVQVTNNNFQDVDVYAVSSGQSSRLGIVTTVRTETFTVPATFAIAGQLRLLVDPIGSVTAYLTDEITVEPGDTVALTVQPDLDTSILTIR